MTRIRVLPTLLLSGRGLVKTRQFRDPVYLGDPCNVMRIFNEKEVDEIVLLDIKATIDDRPPAFEVIREIVNEAFMPLAYGGGVRNAEDARRLLTIGIEKIVICSRAVSEPDFVRDLAEAAGNQSVVVCLDVQRSADGRWEAWTHGGRRNSHLDPVALARRLEGQGAGEIMLNSIDRDGTMSGYDLDLVAAVSSAVAVPVIACGGAGRLEDFRLAVERGGASAVAAGSLFVFHGRHRAVLISYPDRRTLDELFVPTEPKEGRL